MPFFYGIIVYSKYQRRKSVNLKPASFRILCEESQIKVTGSNYVISQHPSALDQAHLAFSALLAGKINILVFYTELGQSISIENIEFKDRTNPKFRIFPNGKRDLYSNLALWELRQIDDLIIECLLGQHHEQVSIDTEILNKHGQINFSFIVTPYYL